MKFIGIDLHSNRFNICVLNQEGQKMKIKYELDEAGLANFSEILDEFTYLIVESSTNSFAFISHFRNKVKRIVVVNPFKMKLIPLGNKKTDKVDAEKLATYLKMCIMTGEELICEVYVPEEPIQKLRALFSTHRLLRKQVTQIKNRVHSIFKQNLFPFTKEYIFGKARRKQLLEIDLHEADRLQIELLLDHLSGIEEKIKQVETMIKVVGEAYYQEVEVLTSMRGISVKTALAIIADIGDVTRFANAKHFCSYLRSTPVVDSSNETTRMRSTTKFGRTLTITLIAQSLNHFRDGNPKLNRWYNKYDGYKSKGKIRMALMRRTLTEIYQMLLKGEYHYFRDTENHQKKMQEYDHLLLRQKVA